jgi:hypothetical protein
VSEPPSAKTTSVAMAGDRPDTHNAELKILIIIAAFVIMMTVAHAEPLPGSSMAPAAVFSEASGDTQPDRRDRTGAIGNGCDGHHEMGDLRLALSNPTDRSHDGSGRM